MVRDVDWALRYLSCMVDDLNLPNGVIALRLVQDALSASRQVPVLDSPVHIEGVHFAEGVSWERVIKCLQRQYGLLSHPRRTQEQQAAIRVKVLGDDGL